MSGRLYLSCAFVIETGALGLLSLYDAAKGNVAFSLVWATALAASLAVWFLMDRQYAPKAVATDEPAKTETVPLDPKTVLSRDPVLAKLGREIEAARRAHKPRKHLYAAQSARMDELLDGRGIA